MKKKLLLIFIVAIIAVGAVWFFKSKNNHVVNYSVNTINKSKITDKLEVDGKIEALNKRKIFINNNLKVTGLFFKKGDFVKKGQIIMKFDPMYKNRIVREMKKESITLRKLKRNKSEKEKLFKIGGSTKNSIRDLELDIERSQLIISEKKEELSKLASNVKSPFDGTITSMNAEENYRVNLEKPLFEIADLSSVLVKVYVPEYDITKIKIDQKVKVYPVVFGKDKEFEGEVSKIATLTTDNEKYKNSNSAYVEVEIKLDNKTNLLKPGFTVTSEITTFNKDDILVVSRVSIVAENDKNYIYVVNDDNSIKKTEIQLGVENDEEFEVISGVEEGAKYLRMPVSTLQDGDIIEIKNENSGSSL